MKYEFHPVAELELYEAASHYESEVQGLGHRFADEVQRVIHLLLDHPELGARIDENLRHFVAVAHGSREPEYWRPRVQDRAAIYLPLTTRIPS